MNHKSNRIHRTCVGLGWAMLCLTVVDHAWSQTGARPAKPVHALAAKSVAQTTLVKASGSLAVIRAGTGPLETVRVGDLVGVAKALVKEISPGRLVLEESFSGEDGKPNSALIVIGQGETGGTRYVQRADHPPFTKIQPLVLTPVPAAPATPASKKPPPM